MRRVLQAVPLRRADGAVGTGWVPAGTCVTGVTVASAGTCHCTWEGMGLLWAQSAKIRNL